MSNRSSSNDISSDTAANGAFGVDVTNAGVQIVAANRQRIALFLTNISDTDIYLGFGTTPVAAAGTETGPVVKAQGGSLVVDNWTGAITARHGGAGNKRLTGADI